MRKRDRAFSGFVYRQRDRTTFKCVSNRYIDRQVKLSFFFFSMTERNPLEILVLREKFILLPVKPCWNISVCQSRLNSFPLKTANLYVLSFYYSVTQFWMIYLVTSVKLIHLFPETVQMAVMLVLLQRQTTRLVNKVDRWFEIISFIWNRNCQLGCTVACRKLESIVNTFLLNNSV